jgi:hypothetical protein
MDDPGSVCLGDRLAGLHDPPDGDFDGQGAALVEDVRQVVSLEKLHDHVGRPRFEGPDIEDLRRVLAAKLHGGAGLAQEALDCLVVAERLRPNELEGDALIELLVPRGDDDAHSARPKDGLDSVLSREQIARVYGDWIGCVHLFGKDRPRRFLPNTRISTVPPFWWGAWNTQCFARIRRCTMRLITAGAAALLAGVAAGGCTTTSKTPAPRQEEQAKAAPAATMAQAGPPKGLRARARELVEAAGVELADLSDIRRAHEGDPAMRAGLDRQIAELERRRDAVLADSSLPSSPPNDARLRVETANLQRALAAGASTLPQAPPVPPIQRRESGPAGSEALPPPR